jgi:hypothetical protein
MLIWQFRDDPQVVKFMTRFVAKVSLLFRCGSCGCGSGFGSRCFHYVCR